VSTGPAQAVCGLNPVQVKPAFASLDRVSLVPTADSWAVRPGPAVSVALASAGFQVSAPSPASVDRYVVGCDFLDLTFYFSFDGLFSIVGRVVTILQSLIRR
jgi:hypothetical protein